MKWSKWIPYIICLILGLLLYKGCAENKHLKDELKTSKRETADLIKQIEFINSQNDTLLNDVSVLECKVDSLKGKIQHLQKIKNKVVYETVEKVIESDTQNDTIKQLMRLNDLNNVIIWNYEIEVNTLDSVIQKQALVIQNDKEVNEELLAVVGDLQQKIITYNKELITERRKKMLWQTVSVGAGVAIVILAL